MVLSSKVLFVSVLLSSLDLIKPNMKPAFDPGQTKYMSPSSNPFKVMFNLDLPRLDMLTLILIS